MGEPYWKGTTLRYRLLLLKGIARTRPADELIASIVEDYEPDHERQRRQKPADSERSDTEMVQ
jgi:hypothetical protein